MLVYPFLIYFSKHLRVFLTFPLFKCKGKDVKMQKKIWPVNGMWNTCSLVEINRQSLIFSIVNWKFLLKQQPCHFLYGSVIASLAIAWAYLEMNHYIWKIKQEFFISNSGVASMNRIDAWALTLVGPTGTSPVLDPLAVLCLNNRLRITRPIFK